MAEEIGFLFKKMMSDLEGFTKTDKKYQEEMKDFDGIFKINWLVCGMQGYQIFEKDKYSYKYGEILDYPEITIEILDEDSALRFLKGEPVDITSETFKDRFNFNYNEDWRNQMRFHPMIFCSKLPMIRDRTKKHTEVEEEFRKENWVSDNSGVRLGMARIEEGSELDSELGFELDLVERPFINGYLNKTTRFQIHVKNQSNTILSKVKVDLTGSPQVEIITKSRSYGTLNKDVRKNLPFEVIPREMGFFTLNATLRSKQGHEITLPLELTVLDFVYYPISKAFYVFDFFNEILVDEFGQSEIKAEEVIEIYDFEYFALEAIYALALLNHVKEANIRHGKVLDEQDLHCINELIKDIHGLQALFKEKKKNPDNYKEFLINYGSILIESNILKFT